MSVSFSHANTQTEITKWYTVEGAPLLEGKTWKLLPSTVKVVFVNDKLSLVSVQARVVTKTGMVSDRWQQVPNIYTWNNSEWPEWLRELVSTATSELISI